MQIAERLTYPRIYEAEVATCARPFDRTAEISHKMQEKWS